MHIHSSFTKRISLLLAVATIFACGGSDSSSHSDPGTTQLPMPFKYNNNTGAAIRVKDPHGGITAVPAGGSASTNVTLSFTNNAATQKPDDTTSDLFVPFDVYTGAGVFIKHTSYSPTYGQVKN